MLVERPPDMISARSRGLPALAVPGDDAWEPQWARLLAGRHVGTPLRAVIRKHEAVAADPERTGGLAWTQRTRGALTGRERRRLLGEIVRAQAIYVAGRWRLATGRVPEGAGSLSVADFRPPDSAFARTAEEACGAQSPAIRGHSHRSWLFGSALAALDLATVDPELFYVACLLHDYGLEHPVTDEDFTLRSAQRAQRCAQDAGVPADMAATVENAITVHTTPGIRADRDGPAAAYLQAGALLDLIGLRAEDLTRAYRAQTAHAHPRAGFTREITALVRAEARANPRGRFGLLWRCGFNPLINLGPLRPR